MNTTPRSDPPSYKPRDSTQFTGSENVVNSNVSGVADKKLPAQQVMKRALPPSFNAPPDPSRNVGDYTSPAVGNKNSFGDGYYRGAHAEIGIQRGVNGVRILPPSMTHGASSASPLQYGGQSDPIHRVVGIVEDRNSENDERLIYQAALRVFIL